MASVNSCFNSAAVESNTQKTVQERAVVGHVRRKYSKRTQQSLARRQTRNGNRRMTAVANRKLSLQ